MPEGAVGNENDSNIEIYHQDRGQWSSFTDTRWMATPRRNSRM
jgi:hypothetical protein